MSSTQTTINETLGEVGEVEIEVVSIGGVQSRQERDLRGTWLTADVAVEYRGQFARGTAKLTIGCCSDTDDDYTGWCAANEGARIIEACISGREPAGDTRGTFIRDAMPDACDEIGVTICQLVRKASGLA